MLNSKNEIEEYSNINSESRSNKIKKLFVRVVLFVLFIAFVALGISSFIGNKNDVYVAKIGSEIITDIHVNDEMAKVKQKFPNVPLNSYFRSFVIQDLVMKKLLFKEAKELGLFFSDDIIARYIINNKDFCDENDKFDKSKFSVFLLKHNIKESEYIEQIRQQFVIDAIALMLNIQEVDLSSVAKYFLKLRHEIKVFDMFIVGLNSNEKIVPTKQELNDFYLSNKNLFSEQKVITIDYISSDDIFDNKVFVSKKELQTEFDNSYNGKHLERRSVYMLTLNSSEDINNALFLIKNRKKDFVEVATMFGKDMNSINFESIGYFDLQPHLRDVIFDLPLNKTSDIINIEHGKFVIARVNKITSGNIATEEKNRIMKEVNERLLKQKKCEYLTGYKDKIKNLIESGKSIKDIATSLSISMRSENVTQDLKKEKFENLLNRSDIHNGFIDINDFDNCGFDVIEVRDVKQFRHKEFDEAYEDIFSTLIKRKKEEILLKNANVIKSQLEKLDNKDKHMLENFAKGGNVGFLQNIKISKDKKNILITDEARNMIYSAKKDVVVGPFITHDKNSYVILIVRDSIQNIRYEKDEINKLCKQIFSSKKSDIVEVYKNYLYEKYGVVIYKD